MKIIISTLGVLLLAMRLYGAGNDNYASISDWFGLDPNAGKNSFLSLLIPSGYKYEGMATAHTAMALDGGYLEANPAAGSFLPYTVFSFSHIDWIDDSALETITYSFRSKKIEDLSLGFNTKYFHVPMTGYNDWGSQYSNGGGTAAGWYSELIATIATSYNFLRTFYFGGFSVGASLKAGYRGVTASLEPGQNALSLMGDIGIMTRFNLWKLYASREMNFAVGMTLKNMGAEFITSPDPLPSYFSTGFSYKPTKPITMALDINIPFNLNGEQAESPSVATGINVNVSEFFSFHSGLLLKKGKPRLALGASFDLRNINIIANYTLDLATRFELFDRISIGIRLDLEKIRLFLVKEDVQKLYLEGLNVYAEGHFQEAIVFWENALSLDPSFLPAQEMIETAQSYLDTEEDLRENFRSD